MLEAQLCWPLDQSAAVIPEYSAWASALPQEMAAYGWYGAQDITGLSGTMFCTTIVYNGPFEDGTTCQGEAQLGGTDLPRIAVARPDDGFGPRRELH